MKQAGVMLIVNQGMILAISRRYDKNIFGLPGGKYNPEPPDNDRDTKDTAIRETREETSVEVKECQLVYERVELGDDPNGVDYYSRCYYATSWAGVPVNSEEGDVKWLTPEEITSTKAAFGDYNRKTLDVFKTMFPNVYLKGETPHRMPTPEEMGVDLSTRSKKEKPVLGEKEQALLEDFKRRIKNA